MIRARVIRLNGAEMTRAVDEHDLADVEMTP